MTRGTPRQTYSGQEGRQWMGIAYLIGTLGAWIIIVVGLYVGSKTGLTERAWAAWRRVDLPAVPDLSPTGVHDVLQGITNHAGSMQQSTTSLWQRGSRNLLPGDHGAQPSAGRRP